MPDARPAWWNAPDVLDTLRLSTQRYAAILARLAGGIEDLHAGDSRRHPRVRFWRRATLFRLTNVVGERPPYRALPNNISTGGISVLHGFFIQAGQTCEVALQTLGDDMLVSGGRIVRCRHLTERVHELGIAFAQPVDLARLIADFVAPEGLAAEDEPAERFRGRVLCVDDCDEQRDLFVFIADELGVTALGADSLAGAQACLAMQSLGLVLVKLELPDGTAAEAARMFRAAGYTGHIAAVSADPSPADPEAARLQAAAIEQGCDSVLTAPLTRDALCDIFRGVLAPDLGDDEPVEPLYSDYWPNVRMRPLILKFAGRLEERVAELEALLRASAREAFRAACRRLAASSEGYGYRDVARRLIALDTTAHRADALEPLQRQLAEIARLSAAARRVPGS